MSVIQTKKLTKSFGKQQALRGVDLTVEQGEVYGFIGPNGAGKSTTIRILLERFQLDPTKKCRTYSKGNRQKVALVFAFASDAELFILDEPTSGLDPLMETVFQEYVAEVKRNGKTVFEI